MVQRGCFIPFLRKCVCGGGGGVEHVAIEAFDNL